MKTVLRFIKTAWNERVWRTNGITKPILKWKPNDKRRPKRRWLDKVETSLVKIEIHDGQTLVQDMDGRKVGLGGQGKTAGDYDPYLAR